MSKLTFNTVAREICKREESNSREVNITDVSRVMKHLFDILSEDAGPTAFGLDYDRDNGKPGFIMHPGLGFVVMEIGKRVVARARKSRKAATGKKGR